jgi:uncharacterized protein YqgV (UPF0045/DUF77 family)
LLLRRGKEDRMPTKVNSSKDLPQTEGLSSRDRDRAASLADEGGASAATVEKQSQSQALPAVSPAEPDFTEADTQPLGRRPSARAQTRPRRAAAIEPLPGSGSMLFELSVLPVGGDSNMSDELARVLSVIDGSGLPYRFGPSSTAIEGSWDAVMPVIRACHQRARESSSHVVTLIQIEDDAGQPDKLRRNVASVERKAGRDLDTDASPEARDESPVVR